jgi:pimeloyl-ACP methyl ester carboxylesterase/DNA-binding CsgD family transcriptional regulator
MDEPLIRYATTTDGIKIAYWAIGQGPVTVQLPGLPHSHIRMEWEIPEWRRGYELGATVHTMVRYDGRGTGLSEREVFDFSLDVLLADLDAVVDALGVEQVTLNGITNTCPVAIAYAVRHPERVANLILWCPVVDGAVQRNNRMLQAARRVMETDWEMFSETVAHSLVGWSESDSARRFAELIRAGISQQTALAMVPALHKLNVTDLLPQISCPTLILHRPNAPLLPPGAAEQVAASIPNAQLALFDGTSSAPFIGDWRAIIRTIGGFLDLKFPTHGGSGGRRALRLLSMKNESLTPREREVVDLVVRGLTNRQIAEELYLSQKTVGNHISRILTKLDLASRTQLAAYAVEHGLTVKTA